MDLPHTLPLDDVRAAIRSLGIPTDGLSELHIDRNRSVTVVHYRTNDRGEYYTAPDDEPVTQTTVIGLT